MAKPTPLQWAITYPVDLPARTVLACLTTLASGRSVEAMPAEISTVLEVPKRTIEDALNRLKAAGAITGKRGKYRLLLKRTRTPVKSKPKLKRKAHKQKPVRVDTLPVWWRILESLAIDKRRGHVAVKPDDLSRMVAWIDKKKLTPDETEMAANQIAARWPINNQKVVYRIFYTYCGYQIKNREKNNGTGLRKSRPSVHARRVAPGGVSGLFKDFTSAGNG
tara:strand:- start:90 stop:752 length:663 start_codon:yes stop_codon:yes gene_type:complete